MRAPFRPCVRKGDAMGPASMGPGRRLWRVARRTIPAWGGADSAQLQTPHY